MADQRAAEAVDALPAGAEGWGEALLRLAAVMARLRDPARGCPWDLQQSFATIAPYTVEEAYEVAQAIADGDMPALAGELGDLLLQVVFHARMAEEAGAFDLGQVVNGIAEKMIRRHPHVFGGAAAHGAGAVRDQWEAIKAAEQPRAGALDGVALALPALMRAEKLQRRAARVGFDWPDADGPRAKILEELAEVDAAAGDEARAEEVGDLLFAVVNYARHLGVDAETALRHANGKFERRFRHLERIAGAPLAELDPEQLDLLWEAVKRAGTAG